MQRILDPAPRDRLGDLPPAIREIENGLPFQRRVWRVERAAWIGLALLVGAGLLGALGRGGPLSYAEAETPDGALRVRYERVQRLLAPSTFRLQALRPGALEVRLGQDMVDGWQFEVGMPPPEASRTEDGAVVLRFPAAPGSTPSITIYAQAQRAGVLTAAVASGSGPPARLRVLVWP